MQGFSTFVGDAVSPNQREINPTQFVHRKIPGKIWLAPDAQAYYVARPENVGRRAWVTALTDRAWSGVTPRRLTHKLHGYEKTREEGGRKYMLHDKRRLAVAFKRNRIQVCENASR